VATYVLLNGLGPEFESFNLALRAANLNDISITSIGDRLEEADRAIAASRAGDHACNVNKFTHRTGKPKGKDKQKGGSAGKQKEKSRSPPSPCSTCGGNHWNNECLQKTNGATLS
jgi:hypothetical protein